MTATRRGIDEPVPAARRADEPTTAVRSTLCGEANSPVATARSRARRIDRGSACTAAIIASSLLALNCRQIAGYGGEVIFDPQASEGTGDGGTPSLEATAEASKSYDRDAAMSALEASNGPTNDGPDSTGVAQAAPDGAPAREAGPADAGEVDAGPAEAGDGEAATDATGNQDADAGAASDAVADDADGGRSVDAADESTNTDADAASPEGSAPNLPRLAGYWKFDEPTGTLVHDSSGNANDGLALPGGAFVAGGFPTAQFANPGSLKLDGDGGAAVLGATGLPAANAPKSVSFWVNYPTTPYSNQTMVALGNQNLACGLQVCLRGGTVTAQNWGGAPLVSSSGVPSAGVWHSIIYTFDGTSHGLYVDGANVGTPAINTVQTCSTVDAMVGTYPGHWYPYDEYYNGIIDDLRVYAGALDPSRVRLLAAGVDFRGATFNGGADAGADAPVRDAGDAKASD